jgi:hypothetical protein
MSKKTVEKVGRGGGLNGCMKDAPREEVVEKAAAPAIDRDRLQSLISKVLSNLNTKPSKETPPFDTWNAYRNGEKPTKALAAQYIGHCIERVLEAGITDKTYVLSRGARLIVTPEKITSTTQTGVGLEYDRVSGTMYQLAYSEGVEISRERL